MLACSSPEKSETLPSINDVKQEDLRSPRTDGDTSVIELASSPSAEEELEVNFDKSILATKDELLSGRGQEPVAPSKHPDEDDEDTRTAQGNHFSHNR